MAVGVTAGQPAAPLGFTFTDVAARAGLTARTIYGGEKTNRYLVETTGSGAAAFMTTTATAGSTSSWSTARRSTGSPPGTAPTSHLYRNRGDGTFEDVTAAAGLAPSRLGPGRVRRRLRQRRRRRPLRHLLGPEPAVSQPRRRHVRGRDRSARASTAAAPRWGAGCAFLDYDRDGRLDLFVANYIDFDLATAPVPESGLCRYKGLPVACGPPGLPGGKNALYRNTGDGTFDRRLRSRRASPRASGTYGLGVSTLDFDDDGWVDLYVANDSNPSALYRNNRDGTFTDIARPRRLRLQPGRQAAGRHGRRGRRLRSRRHVDIFKTNFAGDTSTLYANTRHRACATIAPLPPASASTRAGSGGASASSTSITTAGSICSWSTATSIPEVDQRQDRGRLPAARR